jgi:DNA-binding NarL/FixJ family response regulator
LLIVDDHPFIFVAMRQALLAIGFEAADDAANGVDALQMIEYLMPRFGIMDIDL